MHLQVAFEFGEKTEFATLTFGVLRGIVSRSFHFFGRRPKLLCELLPNSEGRRPATFRMYGLNVLEKEIVIMISKITEGAVQKLRCLHFWGGRGGGRIQGRKKRGCVGCQLLFMILK